MNEEQKQRERTLGSVAILCNGIADNMGILATCLDFLGESELKDEPEVEQFAKWCVRLIDRLAKISDDEVPNEPGA